MRKGVVDKELTDFIILVLEMALVQHRWEKIVAEWLEGKTFVIPDAKNGVPPPPPPKEEWDIKILTARLVEKGIIAKAFDTVNHNLLLKKLQRFGLKDNILTWFKNYLSGRQHRVLVNGEISETRPVSSGVPQGSIVDHSCFSST